MNARNSPRLQVVTGTGTNYPPLEEQARQTASRQRWLKRELAFETARAGIVRRRLANQRGVAFIRPEAFDREFGA